MQQIMSLLHITSQNVILTNILTALTIIQLKLYGIYEIDLINTYMLLKYQLCLGIILYQNNS